MAGKPVRDMWEIDGQKYEKRKYYRRR
jgi:hypothetical protein